MLRQIIKGGGSRRQVLGVGVHGGGLRAGGTGNPPSRILDVYRRTYKASGLSGKVPTGIIAEARRFASLKVKGFLSSARAIVSWRKKPPADVLGHGPEPVIGDVGDVDGRHSSRNMPHDQISR